jgi:hypothetical protein
MLAFLCIQRATQAQAKDEFEQQQCAPELAQVHQPATAAAAHMLGWVYAALVAVVLLAAAAQEGNTGTHGMLLHTLLMLSVPGPQQRPQQLFSACNTPLAGNFGRRIHSSIMCLPKPLVVHHQSSCAVTSHSMRSRLTLGHLIKPYLLFAHCHLTRACTS